MTDLIERLRAEEATHQRNNPRSPWNHGPMCDTFAARKSYSAYRQNGQTKRGQA